MSTRTASADPRARIPLPGTAYTLHFNNNALADYEEAVGRGLFADFQSRIQGDNALPFSVVRAAIFAGARDQSGQRLPSLEAAGDLMDTVNLGDAAVAVVEAITALMRRMGVLSEPGGEADGGGRGEAKDGAEGKGRLKAPPKRSTPRKAA